jgi:hypothetical protein
MQDDAALHEAFEHARQHAVALADDYGALRADNPHSEALWQEVSTATERARLLLERWLGQPESKPGTTSAEKRVLVLA